MIITSCVVKTKCDCYACKNIAYYTFQKENTDKKCLNLCEECAKELHKSISKIKTPRTVTAPFKIQKKIKG